MKKSVLYSYVAVLVALVVTAWLSSVRYREPPFVTDVAFRMPFTVFPALLISLFIRNEGWKIAIIWIGLLLYILNVLHGPVYYF